MQQLLFLLPIAEMIFRFHNPYFRSIGMRSNKYSTSFFFILIHPCEIYFPIELGWFVPCIPYLLPSVPLALNPIHLDPSGFLAIHLEYPSQCNTDPLLSLQHQNFLLELIHSFSLSLLEKPFESFHRQCKLIYSLLYLQ